MKVYIAGPMTGLPQHNFPAFDEAARRWRQKGWHVLNPAEMDRMDNVHEFTTELLQGFLRKAMSRDLECISQADAIALLPGWSKSSGARVEIALAKYLGLSIYCAETMELLGDGAYADD